jgi:N-acyl homoserine lactone hydrolase
VRAPDDATDPASDARPGVARRVVPLIVGWVEVPYSMSVHGADPDERLVEPVPALAIETTEGWLLVDTGLNPAVLRDPGLYRRFHLDTGVRAWAAVGPEADPDLDLDLCLDLAAAGPADGSVDPLEAALARVGLRVDDIGAVVVSHLHNDHVGGLFHFAGRDVEVFIQRAELEFGLNTLPERLETDGIVRLDYDLPGLRWRPLDGETEIAAGVTVVPTAGHTPGHQSVVVTLDPGAGSRSTDARGGPPGYVFACDAADLTENIEAERAIGGFIGVGPETTVAVIRELKARAGRLGYPLVPGHDTAVWRRLVAGRGGDHATGTG